MLAPFLVGDSRALLERLSAEYIKQQPKEQMKKGEAGVNSFAGYLSVLRHTEKIVGIGCTVVIVSVPESTAIQRLMPIMPVILQGS